MILHSDNKTAVLPRLSSFIHPFQVESADGAGGASCSPAKSKTLDHKNSAQELVPGETGHLLLRLLRLRLLLRLRPEKEKDVFSSR